MVKANIENLLFPGLQVQFTLKARPIPGRIVSLRFLRPHREIKVPNLAKG